MNEIALKSVLVRHVVGTDHLSYEISNQALSPLVEWAKTNGPLCSLVAPGFIICGRLAVHKPWRGVSPERFKRELEAAPQTAA